MSSDIVFLQTFASHKRFSPSGVQTTTAPDRALDGIVSPFRTKLILGKHAPSGIIRLTFAPMRQNLENERMTTNRK